MVALFISVIVMGGIYKAIQDETINLEKDEAILDMQNNVRVALERITKDLRKTGFFGCGGTEIYKPASFTFPPAAITFAGDDSDSSNTIDDGTDTSTFRFLGGDVPLAVNATSTNATNQNYTLARPAFAAGDDLLITDCDKYAIFQKNNGPARLVDHGNTDLKRAFGLLAPARVYDFVEAAYRVEGTALKLNGDKIADNIEDLQFEFLEDTDDDGDLGNGNWSDSYTAAGTAMAVRVWILAMSEPVYTYTDTNTYDYPNSPYSPSSPVYSSRGSGSPASQAGLAKEKVHCYRYLASTIIYLRNSGIS